MWIGRNVFEPYSFADQTSRFQKTSTLVMASSDQLLGPPGLINQTEKKKKQSSVSDPFVDLITTKFNETKLSTSRPHKSFPRQRKQKGYTKNGSSTFVSTTNPCVDFFFHILPDTPQERLIQKLALAWKHNDLTALKLICHLRGVRGTGKSDREGFYTAALWLHEHHPKTLACNVNLMAKFGYFKDLPEILYRILEGSNVRQLAKEDLQMEKTPRSRKRVIPRHERLDVEMKKVELHQQKARDLRKDKINSKAKKAIERYSADPGYRFLHDQISQVFADHLISDMKLMECGEFGKVSLASKWCPSLNSSFDRATLICESIAKKVFPRESYSEYKGIEEAHYAFRVRDRLRKEVLVPLRQVLELPEIYMSSYCWDSLPYNRVASVAMTTYKKHFLTHDEYRFKEFLGRVQRGEAKIAAGALLPHEIIKNLDDNGQVAELQWKRMVDGLSAKGKLKNCIAVCDISGNKDDGLKTVSVALGLLLSELSEHPWKGNIITFHTNPELKTITGHNLRSKTKFIRHMGSGDKTDFQKVFDVILRNAVAGKLSKDKMIKKIFVFSSMDFDRARGRKYNYGDGWETDFEVIQKKFWKRGYEVPQLVFWKLTDSEATPVTSDQKGVALVSGFSKNMMTLFLDEEDIDPETVMEQTLSGPEYTQLVVVD